MRRAARLIDAAFWIFLALYAAAFAIFLIGLFGLFGQARDPLAGIFLILLGVPWIQLGGVPEPAAPWFSVLAPVANLVLLGWLARFARRVFA